MLLLILGMGSTYPQPAGQVEGFVIHLEVSEDGTITPLDIALGSLSLEIPGEKEPMILDFDGVSIKNFSEEGLQSLLGGLGLAVEIPRMAIATEQVEILMKYGVQSLAVHKTSHGESQEISIFANNIKAFEAKISDEALNLALAESRLRADAEALLTPLLMMEEATISVRFPGADGEPVFTDIIEAEKGVALNRINMGATMSGNEITSISGVTIDEINQVLAEMGSLAVWEKLVFAPLDALGAEQVIATAGRNGIKLEDDQGKWVEIAWDQESRAALYDLIPMSLDLIEASGFSAPEMPDMLPTIIALAEEWLPNTELQFVVQETSNADVAEMLPVIHIGQVLKVELDEEARLSIGGVSLGKTALNYAAIAPYQSVALRFAGEDREIRSAVAGQAMPIIFFGDDVIAQVGNILAESLMIPGMDKIPWEKGDTLLERVHIVGAELVVAGQSPEPIDLDYTVMKSKVARYAIPSVLVSREDGHVALGNAEGAVDITHYLGASGEPIAGTIKAYVALIPQGFEQASLTVDSSQIAIDLVTADYGSPAIGIRWDSKLRRNLLNVVNQATGVKTMANMYAQELALFGVNADNVPQVQGTLLEYLVGAGTLRWGMQVTIIDSMDKIPPTAVETMLSRFGMILLPESAD
jgi:hypothetical protein